MSTPLTFDRKTEKEAFEYAKSSVESTTPMRVIKFNSWVVGRNSTRASLDKALRALEKVEKAAGHGSIGACRMWAKEALAEITAAGDYIPKEEGKNETDNS